MSLKYKDSEGLINSYFLDKKWEKARIVLVKELEHNPNNTWLLTRLGTTYYEQKDYEKALKVTKKALKLNPNDPLVLWDFATILDMLGNGSRAIKFWKKIIDFGEKRVGMIETGEGLEWARSLICDCYYRIGLTSSDLNNKEEAFENLQIYLDMREKGIESIYTITEAKKKIQAL